MADAIYERPADYDLEHEGDDEDIRFYLRLVKRLAPQHVLELASGNGRVTLPLAQAGATLGFDIVGLELAESMLRDAERKRAELAPEVQRHVRFVQGDLRSWTTDAERFELIVTPCASLTHIDTIDEQVSAWRTAFDNLRPGGRFVVDLMMPDLCAYAESLQTPPRTLLEIDVDTRDPDTGARLLRYKTTRYLAHQQRAEIRFLYDRFSGRDQADVDRYVSDFDCHVYYPREVELLFRLTGFDIEARYGSYDFRAPSATSRHLIVVGRRP